MPGRPRSQRAIPKKNDISTTREIWSAKGEEAKRHRKREPHHKVKEVVLPQGRLDTGRAIELAPLISQTCKYEELKKLAVTRRASEASFLEGDLPEAETWT